MTDATVSRRNKANKRKGAGFETEIREYLRGAGLDTEPLKLSGEQDEGDLVVRMGNGRYVVIEAKNEARIDLAGYIAEAVVERINFAAHRPNVQLGNVDYVAVVKRRGKGVQDAYAVTRLADYFRVGEDEL